MRRVLTAFDSFKDTLTSAQVSSTVTAALKSVFPDCLVDVVELSDGGQGFLTSMERPLNLQIHSREVTGPLGTKLPAKFGVSGSVGVGEMAQASGIESVPVDQRNPLNTTSYGTGEVLKILVTEFKCTKIILGIGGSATNDGGIGALQALGWQPVLMEDGRQIVPAVFYGRHLKSLHSLVPPAVNLFQSCSLQVACDVDNPLTGPSGATRVYGPQKGAKGAILEELEAGLERLALLLPPGTADRPGSGAAGGIAASLVGLCGATLRPGASLVGEAHDLPARIARSDLVLTGEGSFDSQSLRGKTVSNLRRLCREAKVPVAVICGRKILTGIPIEEQQHIYDLVSRFGLDRSLHKTQESLTLLVQQEAANFPFKRPSNL